MRAISGQRVFLVLNIPKKQGFNRHGMDVAIPPSGEEQAMPTILPRRARCLPLGWTINVTGMVASLAAMIVMVPALAEDGDIIVQRDVTPRIAYRGVPTDALPVRTAVGPFPTRAFDQSIGSVVSVLSDGELSASHAWLNNPSVRGTGATPPEVGVGLPISAALGPNVAAGGAIVGGLGGQVVQATGGIAAQISGALAPLSRGAQP